MFCYKCGAENSDNAKFCERCGTNIDNFDQTRAMPQNLQPNYSEKNNSYRPEYNQNYMSNPNNYKEPKNKKGGNVIIIVCAVVCAAVLGMVCAFFAAQSFLIDDDMVVETTSISAELTDTREKETERTVETAEEMTTEKITEITTSEQVLIDINKLKEYYEAYQKIQQEINSNNIDTYSYYVIPYSNQRYLTDSDLEDLSPAQLKIARNEIYARYGRLFNDEALQNYFNLCPWYRGTIDPDKFSESVFNEYEKANKDFIRKFELERGYNK